MTNLLAHLLTQSSMYYAELLRRCLQISSVIKIIRDQGTKTDGLWTNANHFRDSPSSTVIMSGYDPCSYLRLLTWFLKIAMLGSLMEARKTKMGTLYCCKISKISLHFEKTFHKKLS